MVPGTGQTAAWHALLVVGLLVPRLATAGPAQEEPASAEAAPSEPQGWADRRHEAAEEGLTALVYRLDRFFGDPTHLHLDRPTSRVRLRSQLRAATEDDPLTPGGSVLADLRLPSLDRRLSRAGLFITGGNDDDQVRGATEQDLVPRRFGLKGRGGALELRYDAYRDRQTLVDVGAGIHFGLPPPPYVRARVARAAELALGVLGHANQTVFWQRREGFGESTRLDVERVFGRLTVARVWGIATLHERSRGLEWGAETGLQRGLDARTGVYLAAALDGATRSLAGVDRYRGFLRLRRDVHDAWLFLELEPEAAWPADERAVRTRVLSATLRLEVQVATPAP